jgi:serine protease Do
LWSISAALVVGLAAGVLLLGQLPAHANSDHPLDRLDPQARSAVESVRQLSQGIAAVASAVTPSVVTIMASGEVQPASNRQQIPDFFNDPRFRDFFGEFFGNPNNNVPRRIQGLGSGVIVREDGYILTNNHVVQGMTEVSVTLSDGTEYTAKVVGADPRTDLAVIQVDASGLPALPFGDSDALQIGEMVLAVGSPFSTNLSTTVTSGIVSAKGRSGLRLSAYEDFIQTDAAINPGNSGGALVNLNGELVGVNSAIASRGGGSNGIGFSIPSNMASGVMDDLIRTGHVTRGWLGVQINDLDKDLAEAMGLKGTRGVLVESVVDGSPADDAGIERGDVLVSLEGQDLHTARDLMFQVAKSDPGATVELGVLRDGKSRNMVVALGEFPEDGAQTVPDAIEAPDDKFGITVEPITPANEREYNLAASDGLVITAVKPGSPAAEKGLNPGDVILEVDRNPVSSLREYRGALSDRASDRPVLLLIQRGENTSFVAVRPE